MARNVQSSWHPSWQPNKERNMILISTIRKMLQKDQQALVAKLVVKAHTATVGATKIDVPEVTEYFATERQLNDAVLHQAEMLRLVGCEPSKLVFSSFVTANEAAQAIGFNFN
jgi:hypothetical protein